MSARVVAVAELLKLYPRVRLPWVQVFGRMAVPVEHAGMRQGEVVDPVLVVRFTLRVAM